jgi:outer membrane protein assembly factor BamB
VSEAVLSTPPVETKRSRVLRLRFPVICLVAFWAAFIAIGTVENLYFYSFLSQLASTAIFVLLFFGWWFANRGLNWKEKFGGLVIIVSGAWITAKLMDRSVNQFVLIRLGIPLVATVIVLWLTRARRTRSPYVGLSFLVLVYATWACFLLLRSDGADSNLKQAYHWRWSASSEEKLLAQKPSPNPPKQTQATDLTPLKNQWTEFRGASRDGAVYGTSIPINWTSEPTQLWKRAVGPAWSSMIIVGRRLFTQEQRGASEAVVCYDAQTGDEIWAHEDATRFEEALSGAGPRATPTFHEGKLFTLGGTGLLNCLDAATGKSIWQRDIKKESGARVPMWAFSGSPLIADGKVIVYAGGEKGILAFSADKGDLVWTSPAGKTSYSSPQLNTLDGVAQVVMLLDEGLLGADLATGKKLWETGLSFPETPRSNQPHLIGTNQFVVGGANNSINLACTSFFKIAHENGAWNASTNWISKDLKPEFPDIVVYKDYVYGFDVNLFACVSLADGKRAWKEGRYGRGQVILLADQGLLLVAAENGDLVLLAADPSGHREIGKFKALEGKTWAGPIVDVDKIYHRNAQEMACYSFSPRAPKKLAAAR